MVGTFGDAGDWFPTFFVNGRVATGVNAETAPSLTTFVTGLIIPLTIERAVFIAANSSLNLKISASLSFICFTAAFSLPMLISPSVIDFNSSFSLNFHKARSLRNCSLCFIESSRRLFNSKFNSSISILRF